MDALQIEIFNGSVFSIINGAQKMDIDILVKDIKKDIEEMKEHSLNKKKLFQLYFGVFNNQISIGTEYPAQIVIRDCDENIVYSNTVYSIDEFRTYLKNYSPEKKRCVIFDLNMDVSRYKYLIFSNRAMQRICAITQQYLSYNDICTNNLLTLQVETSVGIEKLFENGIGKSIQNPIVNIVGWDGITKRSINVNDSLYVEDLNNFISSICMDTGNYALSLKVFDRIKNKYTILHLRCGIETFWTSCYETCYQNKKNILLSKDKIRLIS